MNIKPIRLAIAILALSISIINCGCNSEGQNLDSEDSNMNDPKIMQGKDTAQTGDTLNSNSYVDTTTNTPKRTPQ